MESPIMASIFAEAAFDHIEKLAKLGPRNVGSGGDLKSAEYISNWLIHHGLDVKTDVCNIGIFDESETKVSVLAPDAKEMKSIAHYRSGCTIKNGIQADLVYVGYGQEQDYGQENVKGKIVLSDIGMIHPVPKSDIAAAKGAIGCIWPHSSPGNRIAAWGLDRFGAKLPVVGISFEDGEYLKNLLRKNAVKMSLKVDASIKKGQSNHVIGVLKGGKKADESIMVIAHRETTHTGPGANDNASGVAVLLELAKVFSKHKLDRSLIFMFSTAEEGGAFGMYEYVDKHREELKKTVATINLDMLAVGTKLRIIEEGRWPHKVVKTTEWLNDLIRKNARNLGYRIDSGQCAFGLADTGPFLAEEIPSTWITKQDDPFFHTKDDTPDKLNPNDLKVAADIVAATLVNLSEKPKLP